MAQQNNSGIIGFWTTARSFFFSSVLCSCFYFHFSQIVCLCCDFQRKKKWKKSCVLPRFSLLFKEKNQRWPFFVFLFLSRYPLYNWLAAFLPTPFFFLPDSCSVCARGLRANHTSDGVYSLCLLFFFPFVCMFVWGDAAVHVSEKKEKNDSELYPVWLRLCASASWTARGTLHSGFCDCTLVLCEGIKPLFAVVGCFYDRW